MVEQIKATCEGLIGHQTASGYVIDTHVVFCALPSVHALGRTIWIRNRANGLWTFAQVLDVGPWNTHDDRYVFGIARPQAETGKDTTGRPTNKAGIDLGPRLAFELRISGTGTIDWQFADPPPSAATEAA